VPIDITILSRKAKEVFFYLENGFIYKCLYDAMDAVEETEFRGHFMLSFNKNI